MAGSETAETVAPRGSCQPKQHLPSQAPPARPAEPSVRNQQSVMHCPQCLQGHTPSHHMLSTNFLDCQGPCSYEWWNRRTLDPVNQQRRLDIQTQPPIFQKYSRLYVPKAACLNLVNTLHESPTGGHKGFFHTLHWMQKDYWWPGMSTFLRKFISGCADCQAAKVSAHSTIPGLTPLAIESSTLFSSISVDLITGLPSSHRFDSVMVMVDHGLSKGIIYFPCLKDIDVAGVAQLFFTHVFPQFGLHSKVISDQGPQFTFVFVQELAQLLQYDLALSTAYHPQTDGETEQVNQELETYCYSMDGPLSFSSTHDPACNPQTSLLEGMAWSRARSC